MKAFRKRPPAMPRFCLQQRLPAHGRRMLAKKSFRIAQEFLHVGGYVARAHAHKVQMGMVTDEQKRHSKRPIFALQGCTALLQDGPHGGREPTSIGQGRPLFRRRGFLLSGVVAR